MGTNRKFENMICSVKKRASIPDQKYIDATINSLEHALKLYEKEYKSKKYELHFTNGRKIKFQISEKYLSHMLGFDMRRIRDKTSLYKRSSDDFVRSYEYLERIAVNPRPLQEVNQHRNGSLVNYYRVRQRCLAFRSFYNLDKFDFFGVDFRKDKIKNQNHQTLLRSNKLLVFDSNEKDISYFMMGIASDKDRRVSYAETIFPVYRTDLNDANNPKRFIENQKIMIPSKISTKRQFHDLNCCVQTIDECYSKEDVIDYLVKLKQKIKLENLYIDDNDYRDFDEEEYNGLKRTV